MQSDDVGQNPPTIYSFFTREFAPMANTVIQLLQICKAQVDPNLIALANEKKPEAKSDEGSMRKRKREATAVDSAAEAEKAEAVAGSEDDDNQFSCLSGNRIVLKRASHVSDAEDSEDESSGS